MYNLIINYSYILSHKSWKSELCLNWWENAAKHYKASQNIAQRYEPSQNIAQYYETSQNIAQYYATLQNIALLS